jgi:hypothetical protein
MTDLKMTDVTGKHPEVPVCPKHTDCALIFETRPRDGGKEASGFMRCPVCNHVYVYEKPLSLR